jgi:hypothetical protein
MKLLIMQFSPASCHFIPLRFKYSQHSVLKHPWSIVWTPALISKIMICSWGTMHTRNNDTRSLPYPAWVKIILKWKYY